MALIRRLTTASLAAALLTGASAQAAQAYWHAPGRGTGTVATAIAAPNALTIQLTATGTGHTVKISGKAGSGTPYATTLTITLCKTNAFPCTAANGATTLTAPVTSGTYTTTSGNLNTWTTVYAQTTQTQTSTWRDYATTPTPVTNP